MIQTHTIVNAISLLNEFILCEECSKFVDNVETTIEKHLNEFQPVVHAKRW